MITQRTPCEPGIGAEPGIALEKFRLHSFEFSSFPPKLPFAVLGRSDIHAWRLNLRSCALQAHDLIPLLSQDELDRMARFHFEPDRQDFAVARGTLRTLLGLYLGAAPQDLRFSYSKHGKPFLALPYSETGLRFNLSHTRGSMLFAVCRDHQIGVDIEKLRADFNVEEIALKFFSASERCALMSLPQAGRPAAFFHCWTRKEALVKARGDGLSFPLGLFDVSMLAVDRDVTLVTRPDPTEAQQWRILNLSVPAGYAAAVAVGYASHRNSAGYFW